MTLAEFKTVLENSGLPVAYLQFPESNCPDLPIVVYQELYSHNISADNKVLAKFKMMQVDLLTKTKDEESEAKLEAALDDAGIYYKSEDNPNDSELCYRRTYTMEI